MPLLTVDGLAKRFHLHAIGRELRLFDDLSFRLEPGQFLLISGPNGTGKSSLLRCLYRTYRPTGGSAVYESRQGAIDLARAADVDVVWLRREEIGFATQFLKPRPRVSTLDLVAEPLLQAGMGRDDARSAAGEFLGSLGLKRVLWDTYPTTFSGGEQQKVNLARALGRPRRLLLLDEPTASLDSEARAALVARLARLKSEGVAMIGVFHDRETVRSLVDAELKLEPGVTPGPAPHR